MSGLLPNHEVLTFDGWKQISKILLKDKIAILKDNKVYYENPDKISYYPNYEGTVYHIINNSIDLAITINHNVYVSTSNFNYKLIKVENLVNNKPNYNILSNSNNKYYKFGFPNKPIVEMDSWLTFFGTWINHGWTYKNTVVLNVKEDLLIKVLIATTDLGYKNIVKKNKIIIDDPILSDYLKTINKKLPDWVYYLSELQTRKLIKAILYGVDTNTYFTSSKELADDFTRLCIQAGWNGKMSLHIQAGYKKIIKTNIWKVIIIKKYNNKNQYEEIYNYNGPIYNLEVPFNVYMARHNGKAVWTC